MDVRFRSRRLARLAASLKASIRELGPQVGPRYVDRIAILTETQDVEELRELPGWNLHPLSGPLTGLYTVRLGHRERLILSFVRGDSGTIIMVEEISLDHYKD